MIVILTQITNGRCPPEFASRSVLSCGSDYHKVLVSTKMVCQEVDHQVTFLCEHIEDADVLEHIKGWRRKEARVDQRPLQQSAATVTFRVT